MGLGDTLRKSGFFKKLVYFPLIAGMIGCSSGGDSTPAGPSGGGGSGGGGNDGYVELITNEDGEVKVEVDGEEFNNHVEDEYGNDLRSIIIEGTNFINGGHEVYGFLAKDRGGNYFPSVVYFDVNNTSTAGADNFRISHIMSGIRGRDYEKEIHDESEPYLYNLSSNSNLTFLETVTLDDLHDFYVGKDIIFRNINLLEFSANVTSRPELTFAVEVAKFRQVFIENLSNMSDIMNSVANFFGGSFEKEAYYLDVYKNNLDVLTHESSQKDYSTIKGTVWDLSGNEMMNVSVDILEGSITGSTVTNSRGVYFLKYLPGGDYVIEASRSGFDSREKSKWVIGSDYNYPKCKELNFVLEREHQSSLDTLVLSLNSNNCKDTHISYNSRYPEIANTNFGDEDILQLWYSNYPLGNIRKSRALIKFDLPTLPQNSEIESVNFNFRGWGMNKNGGSIRIDFNIIQGSWSEYGTDWNNQPNFSDENYGSYFLERYVYSYSHSITNLYKKWHNGTQRNYGFAITLSSESGTIMKWGEIKSSNESDINKQSKIEIIYRH